MELESVVEERLRKAGVKSRRFDIHVYQHAQELYNRKPRPTWRSMADQLAEDHPDASPTEGALRQWEKKGIVCEESEDELWTFGEMSPEDDALLMPVLQMAALEQLEAAQVEARIYAANGETWENPESDFPIPERPTRRWARWMVRIRKAAPDLADMRMVYRLGIEASRGGLARVEAVLALAPWRDDGAALRSALAYRLIGQEAYWLWDIDAQFAAYMGTLEKGDHEADVRASANGASRGGWR